jgi:hypothetical protein
VIVKRTDVACPFCRKVVKVYDDPRTGQEKMRGHRDWFTGACPAGTLTYAQGKDLRERYDAREVAYQKYRDRCRKQSSRIA